MISYRFQKSISSLIGTSDNEVRCIFSHAVCMDVSTGLLANNFRCSRLFLSGGNQRIIDRHVENELVRKCIKYYDVSASQ